MLERRLMPAFMAFVSTPPGPNIMAATVASTASTTIHSTISAPRSLQAAVTAFATIFRIGDPSPLDGRYSPAPGHHIPGGIERSIFGTMHSTERRVLDSSAAVRGSHQDRDGRFNAETDSFPYTSLLRREGRAMAVGREALQSASRNMERQRHAVWESRPRARRSPPWLRLLSIERREPIGWRD